MRVFVTVNAVSKALRIAAVVAALVLLAGGLVLISGRAGNLLTELASRLLVERSDAARAFLRLHSVEGRSQLVVAESSTVVTGSYESSKAVLGIDLGTTALAFEVPVRYFYAVDLAGEAPIEFVLNAQTGVLAARFPPLRLLSMEPDIGKLNQQIDVGWARTARFSGEDVRRRFRERVMADLRARGGDVASLMAVREPARKRLSEMTRAFLQSYAPEAAQSVTEIRVRFADEGSPGPAL